METKHSLELSFVTDIAEVATLTIPHANASLAGSEVMAGMIRMVDNGGVMTSKGSLASFRSARLITQDTEDYTNLLTQ